MKNTNETTNWLKGFLIGALIAIVFVMILAGCEKERCYTCTTISYSDYVQIGKTTEVYCGITAKEISFIEEIETIKLIGIRIVYETTTCETSD